MFDQIFWKIIHLAGRVYSSMFAPFFARVIELGLLKWDKFQLVILMVMAQFFDSLTYYTILQNFASSNSTGLPRLGTRNRVVLVYSLKYILLLPWFHSIQLYNRLLSNNGWREIHSFYVGFFLNHGFWCSNLWSTGTSFLLHRFAHNNNNCWSLMSFYRILILSFKFL